jgi:phospholipase/carboxylesterase
MKDRPPISGTTSVTLRRPFLLRLPDAEAPAGGFPVLLGLHGFGEDGGAMEERLAALEGAPYARLFPDAPFPVEIREEAGSRIGSAWYQYTGDQPAFMRALEFAEGYLRSVLEEAARAHPIDPRRVVILGYSQGGYLASVAAFRDRARYRGLVAVACRIKTEALDQEIGAARGYPVLVVHGERDRHTPADRQREAVAVLMEHGVSATLHVHEGGHRFRTELVPSIDEFVRRQIPASSS